MSTNTHSKENMSTSKENSMRNINELILNYLKSNDEQYINNAIDIGYKNGLYNTSFFMIYNTLYNKSPEKQLEQVDPQIYVIYGKCLKEIKNTVHNFNCVYQKKESMVD